MVIVLTVLHVLVACFLVLIVLIQSGKGADIGAAFGGGASQTMFGARGATTVLHKITSGLAAAFMLTSLGLAILVGPRPGRTVIPDEPAKPPAPQLGFISLSNLQSLITGLDQILVVADGNGSDLGLAHPLGLAMRLIRPIH